MLNTSDDPPAHPPASAGVVGATAQSAAARPGLDRALSVGIGLLAFVAYVLTLSRGVLGGDAGELQFVPPILGLTHPTGYPFQVLLHYAWSQLPTGALGSVAYRLNLLDASMAAVAVGVVTALARSVGASRAAAAIAGLSLAFGELWWSQAVRGDKYTLNGLFLAVVLLLFVRWRTHPSLTRLALLGGAFGLSLTHHRSMLLTVPALAVGLLLSRWRPRSLREVALLALVVVGPLALYAYVPWAGARGLPPGSWPVNTPADFVEFLLDRGYTSQLRPDAALRGRLLEEAAVLVRSFGPLGALLGLVGLGAAFWRDRPFASVLMLAFVPQALLGASYLLESHYQLPRHWVFFLPGFLIWSVWVGLGLDFLLRWIIGRVHGRRGVLVAAGVVAAMLLVQTGTAWARGAVALVRSEAGAETMDAWRQDFQRSPVAERFGRLAFELADRDALIVCDWEQATVLWYLQRVEGLRPDLTIRYPIERLDQTLDEGREAGRSVYLSRTLPGAESRAVISSVGPLLQVHPSSNVAAPGVAAPPTPRPPESAAVYRAVAAQFDGGLTLVAVTLHAQQIRAGSVIPFTLHWTAETPLTDDYAVSVRLLGPDGTVLAAHDERHPALGLSPTSRWAAYQQVGDYHELPAGSRLQPGTYQLQIIPYRTDPRENLGVRAIAGMSGQTAQRAEAGIVMPVEVGPRIIATPLDLLAALLAR